MDDQESTRVGFAYFRGKGPLEGQGLVRARASLPEYDGWYEAYEPADELGMRVSTVKSPDERS